MTEIRNKGATASSDELKQLKQLKKLQLFREAVSSDEVGQLQKLKQLQQLHIQTY